MAEHDFDLFVIGAGSGGVRAARMAAQRGARVARGRSRGARRHLRQRRLHSRRSCTASPRTTPRRFEEAAGFGWNVGEPRFDWERLKANRAREIARLTASTAAAEGAGVDDRPRPGALARRPRGRGASGAPAFRAERILVATGGCPVLAGRARRRARRQLDEMFDLDAFPAAAGGRGRRLHRLRVRVDLQRPGRRGDAALSRRADPARLRRRHPRLPRRRRCARTGVDLRVGTEVRALDADADGGLQRRPRPTAACWRPTPCSTPPAACRTPRGSASRRPASRSTSTARSSSTTTTAPTCRSIYAVGDVIDRVQLTPVALAEAMALVDDLFGDGAPRVDYEYIPTAVFTHPNIGTVGLLGGRRARARFGEVARLPQRVQAAAPHAVSGSAERTLMKLVVDARQRPRRRPAHGRRRRRRDRAGLRGGDEGRRDQGVFDETIGIHPTAAEEFVTMREPVAS